MSSGEAVGHEEVAERQVPGGGGQDDVEGSDTGERKPKTARRPHTPTKQEIEEHFPLHVHYRSWCPHCRAGKATSKQHRMQKDHDELLGVTISIDYAFMSSEEKEAD